jgi:hypothetical protein
VSDQVPKVSITFTIPFPSQSPNPYASPAKAMPTYTGQNSTPTPSFAQAPSQEINVNLSFTELPVLNKPVKITETFTLRPDYYNQDVHKAFTQINLPTSFEKVDGDLTWNGNLVRGETHTLSATVKSTKTGSFQISTLASFDVSEPGAGGAKTLFVTVFENGATVSDQVPKGNFTFAVPFPSQSTNPYASPATDMPTYTGQNSTPTPSFSH